ncbi:N-acetylmuramoyl-L-alanine amidase family protein [Deinococcus yavapaiensis]|uniref:N-acetylmuramoyl-L-alanine amidase n=1 Tax=Deinococcus yavapaiensis KR-236 TaxID=694435 RepID=A0A318S3E4_9DEIO|nr:N-acetylmuramoyl-L-alanine amidase [Deinococcus yavapaiensis]PYE53038.1 N-acetylmuramoyl-L-alanine amidase [Deinococcus yavapaiensis KR-236]
MKSARIALTALIGVAALVGAAFAQFTTSRVTLFGREAPSVVLGGGEYVLADTVAGSLVVSRSGEVVRVEGLGRVLLLPLDRDADRAATTFNTVQLGTQRVQARTATLLNDNLYLPLDTLARGLGAQYSPGSFALPEPRLSAVSSRAGRDADRLVLDFNRDVRYETTVQDATLRLTLRGVQGKAGAYTTRGTFLPRVNLARSGTDLVLTAPLPAGSGYRVYRSERGSLVRLVLDVGPGVQAGDVSLQQRLRRPLIVLDPGAPNPASGLGDVALEVAREAGELLTKAGWQVRLTRSGATAASMNARQDLARQSDVFLTLDVGRFPGSDASGLTVYEGGGDSDLVLTSALRDKESANALQRLAVASPGSTRRLAQLVENELKVGGVQARRATVQRALLLRESPGVSLLLELGWSSNEADAARLRNADRRDRLAAALARSVATYLLSRLGAAGGAS